MSKAILIMDMPNSCVECEFQANNVRDDPICILCTESCIEQFVTKDEYKRIDTDLKSKPDWCPLRSMPEKMQVCGTYPQPDGITPSYKFGWNACIDEILKGSEENG